MEKQPKPQFSVERLKQQDPGEWERLYRYYAPRLRSFLFKYFDNEKTIEDVVQQTFLDVFAFLPRTQKDTYIQGLLFTTAQHRAIGYFRERKRRKNLDDSNDVISNIPSPTPSPENAFAAAHDMLYAHELFHEAVANITNPNMKRAIEMLYTEGLTYEEIGKRLGVGRDTACSYLNRAKKQIKEYIEKRNRSTEITFEQETPESSRSPEREWSDAA